MQHLPRPTLALLLVLAGCGDATSSDTTTITATGITSATQPSGEPTTTPLPTTDASTSGDDGTGTSGGVVPTTAADTNDTAPKLADKPVPKDSDKQPDPKDSDNKPEVAA